MMYQIIWDEKAQDDINKFESIISKRIAKKVRELSENPFSRDIRKLKGEDLFRLRVGDYKIIFEIKGDRIFILEVGHRKKIYKK